MKPFLISITSDCQGVLENYIRTIDKIEDSAEPIMVGFTPAPPMHKKIKSICLDSKYPGNLERFSYFPKGFKDEDMIIFTDASDVIFQTKIPRLNKNIVYLATEYERWGGNNWWKDKLEAFNFHDLDKRLIFNMGCWAMSYEKVKDMLNFLQDYKDRFKGWVASDQVLFNWWLSKTVCHIETERPFTPFGCLYNGLEKGEFEEIDGKFYDKEGLLIPIVHANGGIHKKLLIKNKND